MRRINKGFQQIKKVSFYLVFVFGCLFSKVTFAGSHPDHDSSAHAVVTETHPAAAGAHHEEEGFTSTKMSETIMHHISDAYDWHFFDIGHTKVSLPLPVILYSTTNGLQVFMSGNLVDEHHHPVVYKGYKVDDHGHIMVADATSTEKIYDFSITKNVASLMLSLLLLCLIFISVARAYVRRPGEAPKGLQSFMEPLILFVRDDIARPNLGHKTNKFLPYLLSLFFFIWINNLLGLLPGAANVTGNIALTLVLALLTLILTNINGSKHYWGHIFWPPGVPLPVKLILIPVEIVGIFTKPFSLMIRLFANITAGHIIILSIICLIFLFGENGKNAAGGFGSSLIAVPFTIFLFCLELLVAALQAFIFTMLTALFIGQASEDHHEEHPVHEHHS